MRSIGERSTDPGLLVLTSLADGPKHGYAITLDVEKLAGVRLGPGTLYGALSRLEVPLIAAVNGPAIGAGCDLAMMCDIRIASERASFAESFVQIGLIPGDGGTWFLPRAIGPERAAEMTFTGDRIDAATALQWGMVSRVVPHDDLLSEANALADRITKNPTHALRMAKRLLQESRTGSLESTLGMAAAMQPLAHHDDEHEQRLTKWRSTS